MPGYARAVKAQPSSAELLRRWRTGDHAAAQHLLSRHYPTVSRYFELNASWASQDLTQRTFLACIERVQDIRDLSAFPAFLLGVARRQLAMYLRALRHTEPEAEIDPAPTTGLSTLVARNRRQMLLLRALASLPQRDQNLLILSYWEDMSSFDIATARDGNPSTVRTQVERARARLRRRLETLGRGAPSRLEPEPEALEALLRSVVSRASE